MTDDTNTADDNINSKEDKFYDLRLIEVKALRKCIDAIESLQEAEQETDEGIAADHIENAVNHIKLAMKVMGV